MPATKAFSAIIYDKTYRSSFVRKNRLFVLLAIADINASELVILTDWPSIVEIFQLALETLHFMEQVDFLPLLPREKAQLRKQKSRAPERIVDNRSSRRFWLGVEKMQVCEAKTRARLKLDDELFFDGVDDSVLEFLTERSFRRHSQRHVD